MVMIWKEKTNGSCVLTKGSEDGKGHCWDTTCGTTPVWNLSLKGM